MKVLVFALVGAIAAAMLDSNGLFLLGAGVGALVGLWLDAVARHKRLEDRHQELLLELRNTRLQLEARTDRLARDIHSLEARGAAAAPSVSAPIGTPEPARPVVVPPTPVVQPRPIAQPTPGAQAAPATENIAPEARPPAAEPRPAHPTSSHAFAVAAHEASTPLHPDSDPVEQLGRWLRSLLFGGNTVVRVGIFVLLVGVTLLLRWAAEHSLFPIELRMCAAAVIGLALVAVGYRQRTARPGFARTLQGGGVAATYLVVFFSFHTYHLLPASLAFALLACVALSSGVLAVVQDALALIVIGQIGGFLAPVLASTGQGNHVALFSYYLLLNLLILGVAWFKPWRALNLIGFVFTFGIGTAWGVLSYKPEHFSSTEPFLIAFFLLYTAIPVMYALRRPDERSGFVDGTLVFGTPLAVLLLQYAMVKDIHFAMAFSALGLAAAYVCVSRFLYARAREALRSLIETFLALGIGFATLAVPYGLDNHNLTGATWALEGAGLYWVGVRQKRWLSRLAGAVLQLLAAGALLAHGLIGWDGGGGLPLANTQFLAGVLVCGAALFVAQHAYAHRAELGTEEWQALQLLIASGLGFWLSVWLREIHLHILDSVQPGMVLVLLGATAVLLELVAHKLDWLPGRYPALLIVPVVACALAVWQLDYHLHPLARGGAFGYPVAFAACVIVLRRLVPDASRPTRLLHALFLWTGTAFALLEALHLTRDMAGLNRDWGAAAAGITVALALLAVVRGSRGTAWPFREHHETYLSVGAGTLVLGLLLWSLLAAVGFAGDATPLPYVPLLNPLDLAQLGAVIAIVIWRSGMQARAYPNANRELLDALPSVLYGTLFVWFNAMLARSVHHFAHVPFTGHDLWRSVPMQVALSVSWSLLGLVATVLASKRGSRLVWVIGATLLGVVVVKLFTIDLARLSTVAKIGTFLVVGLLLVLVGYLAPVPPPKRASDAEAEPPLDRQPEAGP